MIDRPTLLLAGVVVVWKLNHIDQLATSTSTRLNVHDEEPSTYMHEHEQLARGRPN
jgi:hypothetical protein